MKSKKKLLLFVLALAVLHSGLSHADVVCVGRLNGVSVDNTRPFYFASWFTQLGRVPHYLCALGDEGTALCKQKFAVMLTAFSLGKNVQVTYPAPAAQPCPNNNSSVVPSDVAVINW